MCGFIGIFGAPGTDVFWDIYEGLVAVQHRGQDAAGAVTFSHRFNVKRGLGLVRDVFTEHNANRLRGSMGLGHVRYPTVGAGDEDDIQPFFVNFPFCIAMAHNGNVTNFIELKEKYFVDRNIALNSSCDVEAILYVFARELLKQNVTKVGPQECAKAVQGVFDRVRGAYSVVGFMANQGFFAFRDPFGIKPLILGERIHPETGVVEFSAASESVVLDIMGFKPIRDLKAGEAVWIGMDRKPHYIQVTDKPHRPCIFELVYFARPDSFLDKVSVIKTRFRFGQQLAREWMEAGAPTPDVVIPIPDSSRDAAHGMAEELGVKYKEGLVKNRYVGRTFIMPDDDARRDSIRRKLNPIRLEFEGRKVLLVDDSLVRGNTARKIVDMARKAGAKEVYLALTSAPLVSPCPYGIDMATKTEFIAKERTVDQIRDELRADYLFYLSQEGMAECAKHGNPEISDFCMACFDGNYPTGDISEDMLESIACERVVSRGKETSPVTLH
ncbi:MAG: amidophosphoribosyltransferase [Planctomycetes bacterium]|nr:amidophosphoribosyltransferase [Planctomycetota bacterium]